MFSTNFILLAALVGVAQSVGIYEQCAGEGYGTFPCNAGLTCFRRNKWYSSCQYSCPLNQGWECEAALRPANGWDQCGGQGWNGGTVCPAGYACYARSIYYSQCRPTGNCPADWACYPTFIATPAPTTLAPTTAVPVTVVPTTAGFTILPAYSQCNNVPYSRCVAGTACYKATDVYAECRATCPPTWACENEVLGINQQCGGEGYYGNTRCSAGLRCFALNQWYSYCTA